MIMGGKLTPLTATFLFMLFAIALGVILMNVSGLSVKADDGGDNGQQSACDPLSALKMKYVNEEITAEEYEIMKKTIGGE